MLKRLIVVSFVLAFLAAGRVFLRGRADTALEVLALRHTFAMSYLRAGGNLFYLSKIPGHANVTCQKCVRSWCEPLITMMKSIELRFFHDGATVHHLTFDRTLFVQP